MPISTRASTLATSAVALAFLLSGFAALVYQLVWQRLLFVIMGVDIESVTVVVSSFMLGLGLGALLGGQLADRFPHRILRLFAGVELLIAGYGLLSVDLFAASAALFSSLSPGTTALLCFGLLLLPTVCMGATLPMLVAHAFQRSGNIGVSTGSLYFINTVGAALGAFAMGFVVLHWLDLHQAVQLAALLNLGASATAALAARGGAR